MLRLLFLTVLIGSAAFADSLTYTVIPNGGSFLYDFTLTNTGETGGNLYDLFVSIPVEISSLDTTTIGTPFDWGDPSGGVLFFGPDTNPSASFIEWGDDTSGLYDVVAGNSLSGFSFSSAVGVVGAIEFAVNGSPVFEPAEPAQLNVSEPSTLFLFFPFSYLMLVIQQRKMA